MKRTIIAIALCIIFILSGCSNKVGTPQTIKTKKSTKTIVSNSKTKTKKTTTYTLAQLKQYTGKNGKPAYVAVNGTVYDVTHARGWNNGKHFSGITAGKDLSAAILNSPHGASVLKNLPIVGKFKK